MKKLVLPILLVMAVFFSCDPDEEENGIQPTADFTYLPTVQGPVNQVHFTNKSENATSYLWQFGDEETSTETDPSHVYGNEFPYVAKLTAYNGDFSDTKTDTIWNFTLVYKPNIYIYPEETIDLCVNLSFPKGGELVTSIPEYDSVWCVTVEPDGQINGAYDYLFYESKQPHIWQEEQGWCISKDNLNQFFTNNMLAYGFNNNEIDDFIEYWIPLLSESEYYSIFPQQKAMINRVIEISFSKNPDNVNRLFYVIEATLQNNELIAPEIIPFSKTGFYVNEWGVILN
ncbi:MAG: PKD domain-containing protein [Salinivirgaceae bacterium]|nr:PKD domain-containing protein [Salinivirgaceae bacterium]